MPVCQRARAKQKTKRHAHSWVSGDCGKVDRREQTKGVHGDSERPSSGSACHPATREKAGSRLRGAERGAFGPDGRVRPCSKDKKRRKKKKRLGQRVDKGDATSLHHARPYAWGRRQADGQTGRAGQGTHLAHMQHAVASKKGFCFFQTDRSEYVWAGRGDVGVVGRTMPARLKCALARLAPCLSRLHCHRSGSRRHRERDTERARSWQAVASERACFSSHPPSVAHLYIPRNGSVGAGDRDRRERERARMREREQWFIVLLLLWRLLRAYSDAAYAAYAVRSRSWSGRGTGRWKLVQVVSRPGQRAPRQLSSAALAWYTPVAHVQRACTYAQTTCA